ncbi:MAG: hypothetical protein LUG51_15260 [Tannerellaceae bacterium]|nr:hypothetical protein [Tannerellaceae bacterium]
MKTENTFGRLLILLFLTWFICVGLYWLPERICGQKIKKVDLFSDIRQKPEPLSLDSLIFQLEQADTWVIDSAAIRDSIIQAGVMDSVALVVRDSLYHTLYALQGGDSLGTRIEDYSIGHIGLKHFFEALNKSQSMNRPVRIAFLGDSFIEGDIVVADFREAMQKEFGGHGVGFVPVSSVASQFRPTIDQQSKGWERHSILSDKEYPYVLSGMVFEAMEEEVSLSFKTVDRYPSLKEVSSLKFLYQSNEGAILNLTYNGLEDTIRTLLPPASQVEQYVLDEWITEASLTFKEAEGLHALGIALEDNSGVVVDNFSLRGNSGLLLMHLDSAQCRAFQHIRPYDLIVLQYGLNIVSEEMLQYGWYRKRMVEVIGHLRNCFPETDILMLGVSDRSYQQDGEFMTMPAVLALLHAQRQAAKQAGIPFWNVFGAMGGENSMVKFVEKNWASKDYTHLSFRGGREIAKALFEALKLEKEFYDEADLAD